MVAIKYDCIATHSNVFVSPYRLHYNSKTLKIDLFDRNNVQQRHSLAYIKLRIAATVSNFFFTYQTEKNNKRQKKSPKSCISTTLSGQPTSPFFLFSSYTPDENKLRLGKSREKRRFKRKRKKRRKRKKEK
jgi:hypothetical protein